MQSSLISFSMFSLMLSHFYWGNFRHLEPLPL
jgi:hypothetical protein